MGLSSANKVSAPYRTLYEMVKYLPGDQRRWAGHQTMFRKGWDELNITCPPFEQAQCKDRMLHQAISDGILKILIALGFGFRDFLSAPRIDLAAASIVQVTRFPTLTQRRQFGARIFRLHYQSCCTHSIAQQSRFVLDGIRCGLLKRRKNSGRV